MSMETKTSRDEVIVYLPEATITINSRGPYLVRVNRTEGGATETIVRRT